jgi:hypothetical protein
MERRVCDGVAHPRESLGGLTPRVFLHRIGSDRNKRGREECSR